MDPSLYLLLCLSWDTLESELRVYMASEEQNPNPGMQEIQSLRSEFRKFVDNDHQHLAKDVAGITGEIKGLTSSMDRISERADQALKIAFTRLPMWATMLLTFFSSICVGLIVWILSN